MCGLFLQSWLGSVFGGNVAISREEACVVRDSIIEAIRMRNGRMYAKAWKNKVLSYNGFEMKFDYVVYGENGVIPKGGRSLYISLHGGGGTLHEVNDQQWENQLNLYNNIQEGVYVCPRSICDTWDMHFRPEDDELYTQIIELFSAYFKINPDRVYIMGYSAGGDGVWRVAPRMADRWAAASMMAGHPGDVSLDNLLNTPFMIWCGALDDAYNRNLECAKRGLEMDSLQKVYPQGYKHETHIVGGVEHWMNCEDWASIYWMDKKERNPYPEQIIWKQEEVLRNTFYYISVPDNQLKRGKEIRLSRKGNVIDITKCDYDKVTLWLNDDIVDMDDYITITVNGKILYQDKIERNREPIEESAKLFRDKRFIYFGKVDIVL